MVTKRNYNGQTPATDGKDEKKAFALIDDTVTYTGKDADGFYSTALLTGNTKDVIRKIPNVKTKVKLGSLNLGDILQHENSCSVPESGDYTLAQKTLEVCDLAFNIPLCEKDYEGNYLSEMLRPGSNVEENYPNGFLDYLLMLVGEKISEEIEAIMWATTGSPTGLCDGFVKLFLADSEVLDVQSPTTLTSSNIITEMLKVTSRIPTTIKNKGKDKVKIFMSIEAFDLYETAIVNANPALYALDTYDGKKKFKGYEIIVSPGMGTNTMVACDPMNLWYGFDLLSDEREVAFIRNPNAGERKKANIVGSLKIGFNYGVGAEIVLYGTGS